MAKSLCIVKPQPKSGDLTENQLRWLDEHLCGGKFREIRLAAAKAVADTEKARALLDKQRRAS